MGLSKAIKHWAEQLRLGGLAKIGWPGIIIVEGGEPKAFWGASVLIMLQVLHHHIYPNPGSFVIVQYVLGDVGFLSSTVSRLFQKLVPGGGIVMAVLENIVRERPLCSRVCTFQQEV